MEKELRELGAAGFEYRGQTAFVTAFRGREVIVILEKDETKPAKRIEYRLVATTRTSTMQKELQEAGAEQFIAVGMTVCKGFVDELEIVTILKKTEEAQGSGKK
jgi:Trk K+ transport system NAD-binding subunit